LTDKLILFLYKLLKITQIIADYNYLVILHLY